MKGQKMATVSEMNAGIVSKAVLGKPLRAGVECIRDVSSM